MLYDGSEYSNKINNNISIKLVGVDGDPTIQEYLKARDIKFVPFAVEGTGAFGPAVRPFIKQVSQEAKNNGSTCSAPAFRRKWETRIAMCLARGRCAAALDRVCDLCSKNNTAEGSSYVPLVDEYELASEFAELRDEHHSGLHGSSDDSEDDSSVDTYHSFVDDPAGIGNDDGGCLSSESDNDDDDDDDCD